jgi:hypothetical protein
MRRSIYPLRLRPMLMEEARNVAKSGGLSLNQLINVAVEEKLAALQTVNRFQERIRREGRWETVQILGRVGIQNPPMKSEERPSGESKPHTTVAPELERAGQFGKAFGWATPQFGKLKKRLERMNSR